MSPVYFDHNATSPLLEPVREAMMPWLGVPANASSRHYYGRNAKTALQEAREQVAQTVGAHPSQIVFTSGGTEANNLAIQGICAGLTPGNIAISAIEHPAVSRPTMAMKSRGWRVSRIAPDSQGVITVDQLEATLSTPTALVSIMQANNETGVIQDIATLAETSHRHGALLHTDAVQALGKMPLDFNQLGVNAMTLSGHKIGGPQGVGALVIDKRLDIHPLIYGGGQEKGLRSGTENLSAIVGFGLACELVNREFATLRSLRDFLEKGVTELGGVIFGHATKRLPNTSFFAFPDIDGETLVMALDRNGFAVASGSACSSDSSEPSPVLIAMGVDPALAQGAVRVSLGHGNTLTEINQFLTALRASLARLQSMPAIAA